MSQSEADTTAQAAQAATVPDSTAGAGAATRPGAGIDLYVLNAVLAFAWALATGTFTLFNLILGFVLGTLALYIPRRMWGDTKYFQRGFLILRLVGVFLYELLLSGISVVRMVFDPKLRFRSGILAIPLDDADTDFEITLFANLISLTPGTLSLDVSDDRRTLYVHAMDASDPEEAKADMKRAFERNIAEAMG